MKQSLIMFSGKKLECKGKIATPLGIVRVSKGVMKIAYLLIMKLCRILKR